MKLNERTLFVVVGDRAREQVVNLHYMLSKAVVKSRPNVLWCYKKELYLSSHKKKRMKQIKKMVSRTATIGERRPVLVAASRRRTSAAATTPTRRKYWGTRTGCSVLQDSTVDAQRARAHRGNSRGWRHVVLLLSTPRVAHSQLYTLSMDVHARFRTESHQHVTARFNEALHPLARARVPTCIMMDDELNILPISSHVRDIQPVGGEIAGAADPEDLADLKGKGGLQESRRARGASLRELLQGRDARPGQSRGDVSGRREREALRSTVALTAARGRGKSAAMGIAVAGAIGMGYANVFVTSPSPENLNTFFQFVLKGFDALGYKEHLDYDLVESSNPAFGKAIVRVNVTRAHRQTIQYILPQHAALLDPG